MDEISKDDLLNIQDLYFKEKNSMYKLQYNHFNQCLEETIPYFLKNNPNKFFQTVINNKIYSYKFVFDEITIKPPHIPNTQSYMFPEHARRNNYTYSIRLEANIKQIQEIKDINTGNITETIIGNEEKEHPIAQIPLMVKSKYCNTNIRKDIKNTECTFDPGCYFIVKGNEKVVIGMERMIENKILVFIKKTGDETGLYATVNSRKNDYSEMIQTFNVRLKKDLSIIIESPHFNDIPLVIFLRALGMENDKEIVSYISNDLNDINLINILRYSLRDNIGVNSKNTSQNDFVIKNKEDAITSLISKVKKFKKLNDDDNEDKKKIYIYTTLEQDVLPHLNTDLFKKAIYICYMVKKLLYVYLERSELDDRDNYINKRIDTPGILIGQLFKQYYKKMLNDISRFFEKKYTSVDDNPINVINQIKYNVIEQGLINGLSTGVWGIQKARKGVSQALQRYSYLQTISYFRRIITPSVDSTTQKVVSIRHARNNQYGFIDTVETPEGAKIGLQKHLSLMSDITLYDKYQNEIIQEFLEPKVDNIYSIHPLKLNDYAKILINGNLFGLTNIPNEILNSLKKLRNENYINKHVSLIFNNNLMELIINTDGGRIVRPLLNIENNKLNLKKEYLNNINFSSQIENNKINTFNEFILKYKNIVQFIDIEESEFCMIAMDLNDLKLNMDRSNIEVKNPNKSGDRINRYNETVYVRFTHMEFHPSMMLGTSSSCIPCLQHNQAPRNIYNFSQSKQGQGIPNTNQRYRIDISYVLANTSYPLVQTRSMKYLNTLDLPNGENAIVAICCYTGYNQEDSLIINKGSIDRGLYRSYVYKKYVDEIKKNPSTSQDDKFTKPDATKVTGIRKANYNKLNNLGYVEPETKIVNGDVIIGKISPIDPGSENDSKIYKDNSTIYKSNVDCHIDKVYTGAYNTDGYETYTIGIRSEREPKIGDKFASRHGQKGTIGIILPSCEMPFTSEGIQPDIIVNPNAIPSRMTVGQLAECIIGKISALRGHFSDGTGFDKIDFEDLFNILKSYGYDEHGFEELYCGITGKKIKAKIFIGPTYYMRLKHLVLDKIHARAKGPKQVLTRQPPEGRARDGGLRFGEMERDCTVIDTLVTLNNGLSMKIKNFENNYLEVLGYDETNKGINSAKQINFLNKGFRPCVSVKLQDGRIIKCTPEHPILTENGEWIKAKNLKENVDRVKVGITCPELDIKKEINECNGWKLQLEDILLKTDSKDEYLKTLAFVRIIGLLITDGHISKQNNLGRVYLGHIIDVKRLLNDLNLFCEKSSYTKEEHCYIIYLPKLLMNNILKLDGLIIGKKVDQEASFPKFILDCPKPILREFLGSLFGGDGHTCILGLHRGKRDILSSVGYSKSIIKSKLESLKLFMNQLKDLLNKFGICEITIQNPKEISNSKLYKNDENIKIYEIVLHLGINEMIPFSENIGFRYCCHKSQRLEAGISYKRLRNEVIRQRNLIVKRVDEITNFTKIKIQDSNKIVLTKYAIQQAVSELEEKEGIIHNYVIPSTHDISDHLIKGTKFGKFRSNGFPIAEEFLKDVGALEWFLGDNKKYGVKIEEDFIPVMNMKVKSIKNIGELEVCDIEVEKLNNFLAEGVIVHNCMISHGMGLFLKERLVNTSDQFFIHVCSSCGLFAKKKSDRDIYVCQLCDSKNINYNTYKVEIPYGFKLLIQELQSINICPKIKVDLGINNNNYNKITI